MKNKFSLILATAFLSIHFSAAAQDSKPQSAAKKIEKSSADGDNLQVKKMQQQTLSNNRVEKLDAVKTQKSTKKMVAKRKRKQG